MDVLSHPFRIEPHGSAAVVVEGTADANAEAVAVLAFTRRGERPLVPTFGVTDPVFDELDVTELNAGLTTFGPDVAVDGIDVAWPDRRTEVVTLSIAD